MEVINEVQDLQARAHQRCDEGLSYLAYKVNGAAPQTSCMAPWGQIEGLECLWLAGRGLRQSPGRVIATSGN